SATRRRSRNHNPNVVPVSCSDSSHRPVAVDVDLASGLRPTRPVGPHIANFGPMKLLPGRSCETAYSVCLAPKSASVASLFPSAIVALLILPALWPCRLVAEYPGCAACDFTDDPAA